MVNGVTHWGAEGTKNRSNNGATPENKNKTIYYYAAGALTLLLAVKLLSSDFFRQAIDFSITFLPFILLAGVIISNVRKYHKHPEDGAEIRKNALRKTFYLLLITLLFYILYSPGSFVPIGEAISKASRLSSLENYFLVLAYACVIVMALAPIAFFIRVYQKSSGYYKGSLRDSARHLLYSVFFVFVLIFISSILTYPSAYAPITGFVSNTVYSAFLKPDNGVATDGLAQARISSIKSALGKTYNNLTESFSDSSEKLSTTIADTKSTLDTAIARTNKSLKNSLSEDIEAKFDITGGVLAGDLTIEDDLVVDGQSTFANVVPASDDAYDLGSVTKGWDHIYASSLHGSSLLTVGDGSSSHSLSASDDFLVSGNFEVNGTAYLDGATTIGGAVNLNGAVTFGSTISAGGAIISNVGDPINAQDAVTKAYYLANTPVGIFSSDGTTITRSTDYSDDNFNMGSGSIAGSSLTVGSLTGMLKAATGVVSAATAGVDYENPLTFSNSLSRTTNTVTLANDSASPGNSQYYGTNGSGTKGWFTISAGTTDHAALLSGLDYATSGHTGFEAALTFNSTNLSRSTNTINTIQNIATTSGPTFATLNTGQGAYELYAMDQNVLTTSAPTFAGLISPSLTGGAATSSDLILKTTTGVAASGADMLFQTGNNGGTEAMKIDYQGIVYINSLESGAQSFEADAGVVQWVDLPVASAATSTVESYSAMIDGNALLTIYAKSASSGTAISDSGVGIGTLATAPVGMLDVRQSGVKTAADYGLYVANTSTNATTDAINKYGAYVSSTGTFTGAGGTATNNYGIYLATTAGADTNIDILAASGASLTTAGTWTNAPSYRRYKSKNENAEGYLDKLMTLDIDEWQYKNLEIDGMNRYADDPYRHVSPYLDDFYEVFRLGTDKGFNIQDLAGVTLASVKELNKRFIDEKAETGGKIGELENLAVGLQIQITELQTKTNTELNLAQIDLNKNDIALIKQTLGMDTADLGDLSIIGKIVAKKIIVEEVETGKITIAINEDAPTIGDAVICRAAYAFNEEESKCVEQAEGEEKTDGKSVKVETKAVSENSKVFVTAKTAGNLPLAVTKIKDGESFTVKTADQVAEDLEFDWILIEAK